MRMKKLVVTYKLTYEPFLKSTDKGNVQMKCPLGECLLEFVLDGCLDKVMQSIDIKAKESINEENTT